MRIVTPSRIREYASRHPEAASALAAWLKIAKKAAWRNIIDTRRVFPSADAVEVASGRTVTVFNIGGNKFRLIVAIKYEWSMLYVLRFLTHAQYSHDRWKEVL